jgi:predicted anti-sigma-YlaC factor YlaD
MAQDNFTEQLSLWLDNELNDTEVAELQTHLQQCPNCRKAYTELQHIDRWLLSAARVMAAPSPGFSQRLAVRLPQMQARYAWQLWLAVLALVSGGLLVLGFVGFFGGLTIYTYSATLLDAQLLYLAVAGVITTLDNTRLLLSFGGLLLRTGLITMQQPVFWGLVVTGSVTALLWVQWLRRLARRGVTTASLMI